MARLRNPNKQIPGGLKFRQPETGWDSTKALAPMPSLRALAQALIDHRKANGHLAKLHGWKMSLEEVEFELDQYNAKICIDHGWKDFVATNVGEVIPPKSLPSLQQMAHNVAQGVAAARVGAQTLASWFGEGGRPVEKAEGERRASICATCPQNGRGDWTRWFTTPVSNLIRRQIEFGQSINLSTSVDPQLGVCEACQCPLRLKVWVPMQHILKETTEETKKKLDARCWITK